MDRSSQSRRRRAILFAGLALVLALCGYAGWVRLSEPRYQGKRVSVWFQEYCDLEQKKGAVFFMDQAGRHVIVNNVMILDRPRDALVAMGEPAIEYLARQACARNVLDVPLYCRVFTNLPVSIRSIVPNPF